MWFLVSTLSFLLRCLYSARCAADDADICHMTGTPKLWKHLFPLDPRIYDGGFSCRKQSVRTESVTSCFSRKRNNSRTPATCRFYSDGVSFRVKKWSIKIWRNSCGFQLLSKRWIFWSQNRVQGGKYHYAINKSMLALN